jgi:hypothetical protein
LEAPKTTAPPNTANHPIDFLQQKNGQYFVHNPQQV